MKLRGRHLKWHFPTTTRDGCYTEPRLSAPPRPRLLLITLAAVNEILNWNFKWKCQTICDSSGRLCFFMFCLSSLLFLCVLLRFCHFSRDLCTVKDRWANSETARLVGVGVGMVAGLGSPRSCISLEMYINYGFIKIKSCTYLTGSSFTGFFFIVLLSYHDQDAHSRLPALFSIKSWCSFLTRSGLGQNACRQVSQSHWEFQKSPDGRDWLKNWATKCWVGVLSFWSGQVSLFCCFEFWFCWTRIQKQCLVFIS